MEKFVMYIKKNRIALITIGALWLLAEIFVISAIAYAMSTSITNGVMNGSKFIEDFVKDIASANSFGKVFSASARGYFGTSTLYFTLFYIICVGIGLYKARRKNEYDKIEHGSSDWSENGEQYRVISKNAGLILAEKNYLPLNKVGNVNVLIVGGSGSGKSSSYTIPNAHQCLGSYIFTDPKGEIYDATAGYLKSQGYEIKLLNLVNPESSDSYNPIQHIQSEIDVDVIASTIVKGQKSEKSGGSDPYWDNMSELLLKSLIYYLIASRPPEEQNLASCAELVRAANNNGSTNMLSELMQQLPYDHPARMNFKSVELASDKTYSSILSSLQSKLGKFDSKDIADVTSTNTINFEEIATKKTALYVVSSDTHTAYDFLLTIFFSQMIQQLYDFADKNGGKLPLQTFFILDEFANIGQIPDFDKKISTSRSRGISFSVILQNLDQLKSIYEKSYETIIGNCDTHVFLGSNSFATVEYFSKELGEKTIAHTSINNNRDNMASRKGYSESDQIMARALMTPDELRRMDNDDCIIFEKGIKPIKAKKFWWYKKQGIVKDLNSTRIDHNGYSLEGRGEWRKFNPYNPYHEESAEKSKEDNLNIESLDDLFADDENNESLSTPVREQPPINTNISDGLLDEALQNINLPPVDAGISNINNSLSTNLNNNNNDIDEDIFNNINDEGAIQNNNNYNQENNGFGQQNLAQNPNEPSYTNILNTPNQTSNYGPYMDDDDDMDIQKELEAKFDELFGNINN